MSHGVGNLVRILNSEARQQASLGTCTAFTSLWCWPCSNPRTPTPTQAAGVDPAKHQSNTGAAGRVSPTCRAGQNRARDGPFQGVMQSREALRDQESTSLSQPHGVKCQSHLNLWLTLNYNYKSLKSLFGFLPAQNRRAGKH